MNSIDALIALLALMSFFALILGSLSLFDSNLIISTNKIIANNNSKECAVLIDSFFANSASTHNISKNCFAINGLIAASYDGFTKTNESLPKLNQTNNLEVESNAHYK
ncbi:MAG: hypothetical protein WC915_02885 [archaeon]|jgi:hypothetical protein